MHGYRYLTQQFGDDVAVVDGRAFVAAIRDPKDRQIESRFQDQGLAVYFGK
jgi:hypothetical protein